MSSSGATRHGKPVEGIARLGILMLETRFPRIPGDIGNAGSWPFPIRYAVVPRATPDSVVRGDALGLLPAFVAAGRELVAEGCDGIATSCGFLSLVQHELADALGVPVASSPLMQVPMVAALLPPGRRVGVLTISDGALGPAHLAAAGAPVDTPVVGTDAGLAFTRQIMADDETLDVEQSRLDLIAAARVLVARHPEVGAIVLECTNMAPYARDVRFATRIPVFSIDSFINWFHAGLVPRGYDVHP